MFVCSQEQLFDYLKNWLTRLSVPQSKSEHLITLLEDSKQEPSQSVYNNSAALKGPKKLRVQDLRRARVHRWNYLALNVGTMH